MIILTAYVTQESLLSKSFVSFDHEVMSVEDEKVSVDGKSNWDGSVHGANRVVIDSLNHAEHIVVVNFAAEKTLTV